MVSSGSLFTLPGVSSMASYRFGFCPALKIGTSKSGKLRQPKRTNWKSSDSLTRTRTLDQLFSLKMTGTGNSENS